MVITKERMDREVIAMRVAREFQHGMVVNLGIGIPTLCSNFVPEGRAIVYHSESGVLGYGELAPEGEEDMDFINAGGQFVTLNPGASFFHSADSFAMIRGGHVDITVLGALQVSERGDLANWFIPERGIGNVGGAMDLAVGAKRVIAAMEHNDRQGNPKVVGECTYPLTGKGCVSLIVTDLAVIEVTRQGLILKEIAPGWTVEEVRSQTGAPLTPAPDLTEVSL